MHEISSFSVLLHFIKKKNLNLKFKMAQQQNSQFNG